MAALADQAAPIRGGRLGTAVGDRAGAVCGVAFTALAVAAGVVVAPPPQSDAAVTTIRTYLAGHTDGLAVSTALMGIGTMAAVGFFAMVYGRVRRAAASRPDIVPAVVLVAGAVVVASTLLGLVIQAALVHQVAPNADDSTLLAFYALWDRVYHTAPPMGMAVVLLASSTGLRTKALPRWACLLALVAATVMLVDIIEDLVSSGTNLGPLGLIGFGLANVWIVGVALTAWRHPASAED